MNKIKDIFQFKGSDAELEILQNMEYHILYKAYVREFGLVAAYLLVDLISKSYYFRNKNSQDNEGYFYNTHESIEEDTSLSAKQQRLAIKKLQKIGVISMKLKGIPAKCYYKINFNKIASIIISRYDERSYLEETKSDTIINDNSNNVVSLKQHLLTIVNKCVSKENNERPPGGGQTELLPKGSRVRLRRRNKISTDKFLTSNKTIANGILKRRKQTLAQKITRASIINKRDIVFKTLPTGNFSPDPAKEYTKLPESVLDIMEYWTEMGLRMPKKNSKLHVTCIKRINSLLSGKIFKKKYTVDEIKDSITKFSFAALDPLFEPSDIFYKKKLSQMTIGQFILNPYGKETSLFQKYLKRVALQAKTIVDDEYPETTAVVKKLYEEKVLGGVAVEYSSYDENCFRKAAIKINEFFEKNRKKINSNYKSYDRVRLLFNSIFKEEPKYTVTPAWLCSQKTFNNRLPAYMFRQALIDDTPANTFSLSKPIPCDDSEGESQQEYEQ
jgi:hypothetical protein